MNALTAKDVMTDEVFTIPADLPVNRLAEFLVDKGISGAPVVSEQGKLLGTVSLTDIAEHTSLPSIDPRTHHSSSTPSEQLNDQFAESEINNFDIQADQEAKALDIMTPAIFEVYEETSIKDVANTMLKGRIRRVFVTREKKVIGVVSAQDLLKVIANS